MPKTKDDRIQKVLEILNLPAEEQLTWVALNNNIIQIDVWEWDGVNNIVIPIEINWRILADLAFRMRDEACSRDSIYWEKAVYKVYQKSFTREYDNVFLWMTEFAQPIHWICASIIAEILNEK